MKKFLKSVLALALAFSFMTYLHAEDGSPIKNGDVSKDFTINGQTPPQNIVLVFISNEIGTGNPTVLAALQKANDGQSNAVELASSFNFANVDEAASDRANGVLIVKTANTKKPINLAYAIQLTDFQNLTLKNTDTGEQLLHKNEDGKITGTWEVPNLSADLGDPFVVHYSEENGWFEVIEPDAIDYPNRAITCTFNDLSPVAVFYVPASKGGYISGKDPVDTMTDGIIEKVTNNNWLYAGVAVVAVIGAAGYGLSRKKKED